MRQNHIMDTFQSAYKSSHSTETALVRVYNDIVTNIDNSRGTFLVLLDLSSAFDTIDHLTLFHILENYAGINDIALQLIKSYFSDRSQCVQIEGITSELVSMLCGVPQGSVLGPMKFCLYLLPLGAILRHHSVSYHIYADDTQLYISFEMKDPKAALSKLNTCISDIRTWMISNKLKINDSKTEFLVITSPHMKPVLQDISICVGDSYISPSVKACNLGVIFDKFLNLEAHVSTICRSTCFHLKNIGKVRKLLTHDSTAQLIHALITSRLDYCNALFYNMPASLIYRLQKIQNLAARILTKHHVGNISLLFLDIYIGYLLNSGSGLKF
jgi:hypothetical protein